MLDKLFRKIRIIIGNITVKILRIKIFGKHIFMNRYVRRLPLIGPLVKKADSYMTRTYTRQKIDKEYRAWLRANYPSQTDISRQKKESKKFARRPLISVIVPTYNTNIGYLKECINSVINQSYDNWELCLADDNSTNPEVRKVIENFAKKDKRIKYIFRKENGHICKASNSALQIATGKYIALLDHDDVLWPNALYENVKLINKYPSAKFIYSDEDKIDSSGKKHMEAFFKPDWNFDFLRSINYITHFAVLEKKLVDEIGGFREGYEGAQDWDLFLRASRKLEKVYHIPTVIYSWRKSETSTAQAPSTKDYAYVNQKKALQDDVKERSLKADIDWQIPFSMWHVKYALQKESLVSIVIPTKNQKDFIERCLKSIQEKTTYKNFEVVIVDTGSTEPEVWEVYKEYKNLGKGLKVVKWTKPFNFAASCDFGAERAKGEYILFLNNDTEVITPSWIEEMLGFAQLEGAGAIGCKLYYPDGKLQHAGIVLGVGGQNGTPGIAGHFFPAYIDQPPQSPLQDLYVGGARDFTAVTAACVMVAKKKFDEVKGFDPIFRIAFNDVDLCLKLYDKGYRNIYLPQVELYHYESISIGKPGSKERDLEEFSKEIQLMLKKWKPLIDDDPFYHPEFRRDIANARLKTK